MRRRIAYLAAAALVAFAVAATPQAGYDILITGARLLDGSGNPWVTGTVAINGDRIARIGRFSAPAARTIDATGLYVAPGFVDIMDQSGGMLLRDGTAQSKVRQGVTTLIGGERGTLHRSPPVTNTMCVRLRLGCWSRRGVLSAADAGAARHNDTKTKTHVRTMTLLLITEAPATPPDGTSTTRPRGTGRRYAIANANGRQAPAPTGYHDKREH